MKKPPRRVLPKQVMFTAQETAAHRQSMKFTDELIAMVNKRIAFAWDIKLEHDRLTAILQTATGDVRSVLPVIVARAEAIESDVRQLLQKAIDAGEDDIASEAATALERFATAPWKKDRRLIA
jgi:DNA polymerase III delta prime subunit